MFVLSSIVSQFKGEGKKSTYAPRNRNISQPKTLASLNAQKIRKMLLTPMVTEMARLKAFSWVVAPFQSARV